MTTTTPDVVKRPRGRPKGRIDPDRRRRVANTVLLTELILVSAHLALGYEPTASAIEEKLGLGAPSDATGRRTGHTWKNMRRGAKPVTDERLFQLAIIAIRVGWLTQQQLDEVNYALASQAVVVAGPKVVDLLARRRQELTEYKVAKLQAFRALERLSAVVSNLVQSETFDGLYEEFDHDMVEGGLDLKFMPFDPVEALHRLARLDLRFRKLDPSKPRLRRRLRPAQVGVVDSLVQIDEAFGKVLQRSN